MKGAAIATVVAQVRVGQLYSCTSVNRRYKRMDGTPCVSIGSGTEQYAADATRIYTVIYSYISAPFLLISEE